MTIYSNVPSLQGFTSLEVRSNPIKKIITIFIESYNNIHCEIYPKIIIFENFLLSKILKMNSNNNTCNDITTQNENIEVFAQLEKKVINETFRELEFYSVLETISKKCLTQKGRELITAALPANSKSSHFNLNAKHLPNQNNSEKLLKTKPELIWLNKELNQVDEMVMLMTSDEALPLENIADVRDILHKSKISGAILNTQELMQVYDIIRVAREVKNFLKIRTEKCPELSDEILMIFDNPNLQKIITNAIDESGEIKDNATKELHRIRIEIAEKSNRLRSKMNKIVRQFAEQEMTQEDFYTVRDGRFVLPIKSEHKRHLSGIIHGVSQTGSTVYVEPSEIIEMNNEISLLKGEEQREIYNILKRLTSEIAKDAVQLIETYDIIGHIDSLNAKAVYALQFGGIKPEIFETNEMIGKNEAIVKNEIIMNKIYHPILVQNKGKSNVVPLSISFSFDKRGHLISGPNAGGKTVALKSIGLNIILALSGFFPIGEVKTCLVNVFSAIGDHQSIENDLSTFSSQLLKMKEILDVADSNSLVLIDEICSGTDPREGGALAAGILDTFIDLNLFFVVTTHQSSLKTYALNSTQYSKNHNSKEFEHNNNDNNNNDSNDDSNNGNNSNYDKNKKQKIRNNQTAIENGSFEFDETALKPTYNFLTGIPGNSYAFFLAKNVGLSSRVINRSKKYLGNRQKQLERSISILQKFRKETEDIIKESRAEKLKYEGMKKDYENRKKELIEKKKSLIEEAKLEANEILQKANALVKNTIRELREEKKSMMEVKAEFVKQQKEIETEAKMIKTQKQQVDLNVEIAENLKPDDTVGMLDSAEIGIVIEADNDNKTALVEFNGMKFRLPFSQLYLKEKPLTVRKSSSVEIKLDVKTKLDLRGFRAEEALNETTNFIAQAIMGNADYVTIIHGKGTGALRLAIHELLKQTTGIKSFRLGEIFEGGSGITVAYLK